MLLMLTTLMMILTLTSIIMTLAASISYKTTKDREKSSPFECGFSPFNTARIPLSLRFFLIAVIFLIFDVEITLLLPLPMAMTLTPSMGLTFTLMMFLIILTMGLYYEWKKGALEWANLTYI